MIVKMSDAKFVRSRGHEVSDSMRCGAITKKGTRCVNVAVRSYGDGEQQFCDVHCLQGYAYEEEYEKTIAPPPRRVIR